MEMYLDLNGGHMGCMPKVCMLYLSLGRKNAVRKKEKISSFYAWLSLPLPGCVYCGGDLDSLAFLFNALSSLCCSSSLYPFSLAFLLFSSCPLYSFLLLNLGSVPVPLYRSVVPHESLGNETRNAQVLAFGGPLRPQAAGRPCLRILSPGRCWCLVPVPGSRLWYVEPGRVRRVEGGFPVWYSRRREDGAVPTLYCKSILVSMKALD